LLYAQSALLLPLPSPLLFDSRAPVRSPAVGSQVESEIKPVGEERDRERNSEREREREESER